jgi:hypothetical protein
MKMIDKRIASLADNSEYAALVLQRSNLATRLSSAQREIDNLRGLLIFKTSAIENERTSARVAVLLGEKAKADESSDRTRYAELTQLATDITAALAVLDQRIASKRYAVSREFCKSVEPEHTQLVRDIAGKMHELHNLSQRYTSFRNDLESNDVWIAPLNPQSMRFVEALGRFLNDAANDGHIEKNSIAVELRQ